MLDVFRDISSFTLLHALPEGAYPAFQGSVFPIGCWMLDVGCFCPPHFSISTFPLCSLDRGPWAVVSGMRSVVPLPLSAFQFFSISAFPPPPPSGPAGENSHQLAQFAASRGPAPARSRYQPFSFCPSDFCFLLSQFLLFPGTAFSISVFSISASQCGPPRRARFPCLTRFPLLATTWPNLHGLALGNAD